MSAVRWARALGLTEASRRAESTRQTICCGTLVPRGVGQMAQMLLQRDSAAKVKRAVRRHLRLVRRSADEKAFEVAERLTKPLAALDNAMAEAAMAVEAAEDAFDDWNQDDARLDQLVRRLHLRCREWDAARPGDQTLRRVFGG